MASNFDSDFEEMLSTRCHLCGKYLTVPPIFALRDESKFQCGRCKDFVQEPTTRCFSYENFLKTTGLPCSSRRCRRTLSWDDIQAHEKMCAYREMRCPMWETCSLEIECRELVKHMEYFHADRLKCKGVMCHRLKRKHHAAGVILLKEIPFLVLISNHIVTVTPMIPNISSWTFRLELTSEHSPIEVIFKNQQITELYDDIVNCIDCFIGRCERIWHRSSEDPRRNRLTKYTYIGGGNLEFVFKHYTALWYTLSILPQGQVAGEPELCISVHRDDLAEINTILWGTMRCSTCTRYLNGLVFSCLGGHAVCASCKWVRGSRCRVCRALIGNNRFLRVERKANIPVYMCKNVRSCDFIGTLDAVITHDRLCSPKN